MAGGVVRKENSETILTIILEKTGKTRLNRASLRTVPVAELRDVCEAVGIEHKDLTKPELICLLLDAGELNVGGSTSAVNAVVKTEPDDGSPRQNDDDRRHQPVLSPSGQASGRVLTRKSLKPGKPTRANPRRGRTPPEKQEPVSVCQPDRHFPPTRNEGSYDNKRRTEVKQRIAVNDVPKNASANGERTVCEADPVVQAEVNQNGDVNAVADSGSLGQAPGASAEQEGSDEPMASEPHNFQDPARGEDDAICGNQMPEDLIGAEQVPMPDLQPEQTRPGTIAQESPPCNADTSRPFGEIEDCAALGRNHALRGSIDVVDDTPQCINHAEAANPQEVLAAVVGQLEGPGTEGSSRARVEDINQARKQELEEPVNRESIILFEAESDLERKVSKGSSLHHGGTDEGTQVSTGAGTKRAKALIVWQGERQESITAVSGGGVRAAHRKGMFDQVLRASQSLAPHALDEDACEEYDGATLVITLLKPSYAITRSRPGHGLRRRTVVLKLPHRLYMSPAPALPAAESREPLEMSRRSGASWTVGKQWRRSTVFTGCLASGEKAEYAKHGHCITVEVSGLPRDFWYCPALQKRFVIDPMEWDKEYHAGVQRIETSMSTHPETWFQNWIRDNISRPSRAAAIRQFMSHQRQYQKVPKPTYYRHFTNLAKGIQRRCNNAVIDSPEEQAYERGCARMVGCAGGQTFDMLVALPKSVIYDVMVAFGQEPCTHTMILKAGADALLRRLICDHCPPANFDRVVCKHGHPPKVKLGPTWTRSTSAVHSDPPHAPERTSGFRTHARQPPLAPEPRVVSGHGHVVTDSPQQYRSVAEEGLRSGADDLRKPSSLHAVRSSSGRAVRPADESAQAALVPQDDRRDGYQKASGRSDDDKESRRSQPRWRGDSRRADVDRLSARDSPSRRLGVVGDRSEMYEREMRHCSGQQKSSGVLDVVHQPVLGELGRGRSNTGAQSRDAYHVEAATARRHQRAISHEYLPPAPACRGPEVNPSTQVTKPTVKAAAMPMVEPAYVTQGLPDAPLGTAPIALGGANLQEHFQAAVAVAVQEVVKSMGIIPSLAAGGIQGVVPAPIILGSAPMVVQPDTYGSAGGSQYAGSARMRLDPQQGRAGSVQADATELSPMRRDPRGRSRHMCVGMDGGQHRYNKRSRASDDEVSGLPPARNAVPRLASPRGGGERVEIRSQDRPHRLPPAGQRDNNSAAGSRSSNRGWQSPSPGPGLTNGRDRSPQRQRPPRRDRSPADGDGRGSEPVGRIWDRSRNKERYDPGLQRGSERHEDSKRPFRGELVRSPPGGRPPLHGAPRRSRGSDLPLPPPHEKSPSAGGARAPPGEDLRSIGTGRFSQDLSATMRAQPSGGFGSSGRTPHDRRSVREHRGRDDSRAMQDQRVDHGAPSTREILPGTPIIKLRSGGSRVADRRRTVATARPGLADNEDAFAVEYNCFAVGDGFEGKESAQRSAFNSGAFTHELVTQASGFATSQIQVYVSEQGRNLPLMGPVHVLQQASNSVRATGAAAVLLGMLNPLSGCLSIGKVGDVGYLVLRPSGPADSSNDLKVISSWRPYDLTDHRQHFYSTHMTASMDLASEMHVASWAHDSHSAEIHLQPSDLVIAASDGFFDVVHIFGSKGLGTRQYVRELYLENQLDPGQLAEKLLLRAWNQVQSCRNQRPEDIDTPFFAEVRRAGLLKKFQYMPEDDIAVVVSYVLQA